MFNCIQNESHHIAWNHGFSTSQYFHIFQKSIEANKFTKDMLYYGVFMNIMHSEKVDFMFSI